MQINLLHQIPFLNRKGLPAHLLNPFANFQQLTQHFIILRSEPFLVEKAAEEAQKYSCETQPNSIRLMTHREFQFFPKRRIRNPKHFLGSVKFGKQPPSLCIKLIEMCYKGVLVMDLDKFFVHLSA